MASVQWNSAAQRFSRYGPCTLTQNHLGCLYGDVFMPGSTPYLPGPTFRVGPDAGLFTMFLGLVSGLWQVGLAGATPQLSPAPLEGRGACLKFRFLGTESFLPCSRQAGAPAPSVLSVPTLVDLSASSCKPMPGQCLSWESIPGWVSWGDGREQDLLFA